MGRWLWVAASVMPARYEETMTGRRRGYDAEWTLGRVTLPRHRAMRSSPCVVWNVSNI